MSINTHNTPKENLEAVTDDPLSPDTPSETPIDEATVHPAMGRRFIQWSRHGLGAVRQRLVESKLFRWLRPQLAVMWRILVVVLVATIVVALFFLWRRSSAFRTFILTTSTDLYSLPDRIRTDLTPVPAQAIAIEANN